MEMAAVLCTNTLHVHGDGYSTVYTLHVHGDGYSTVYTLHVHGDGYSTVYTLHVHGDGCSTCVPTRVHTQHASSKDAYAHVCLKLHVPAVDQLWNDSCPDLKCT